MGVKSETNTPVCILVGLNMWHALFCDRRSSEHQINHQISVQDIAFLRAGSAVFKVDLDRLESGEFVVLNFIVSGPHGGAVVSALALQWEDTGSIPSWDFPLGCGHVWVFFRHAGFFQQFKHIHYRLADDSKWSFGWTCVQQWMCPHVNQLGWVPGSAGQIQMNW